MRINKGRVLKDLRAMFGHDHVNVDEDARKDHDSDNSGFAKSFGVFDAPMPICILNVASTDEVARALKYCNDNGVPVIPRTGGSSYEKLLTAINDETVVIDASGMNKILKIDIENMMATGQCGVPLKTLEDILNRDGYTTGHYPQSQPVAHLGGLVATRSIGQFSTLYGGIEDLVCGLEAVLPTGEVVRIRNVPRRASGPDLRHLFIGNEGGLAFITEVTMKIFADRPKDFWKGAYIVPNLNVGLKAIRDIMAAGYRPAVVRLYDKWDFDYNYGSVELKDAEAFMFFVADGPAAITQATGAGIDAIARSAGGRPVGSQPVEHWLLHRNDLCNKFKTAESQKEYRETGIFYSTNEISASWTDIGPIYDNVIKAVSDKIDTLVGVGGHVSHCYQNGTNIYFVYAFKVKSPQTFSQEHQAVIDIVCEEVLKMETGGCVHHHGMGKQRIEFAPKEHGSSYLLMKELKKMMDPRGIMNPGVLVKENGRP